MNNKWFFSTKWRHPSSLLAGLLVLVSFHLSLFNSDRCCCCCILNYFVFEAMGDVITVLEHPLHPWSSRGMRMRRLCKRFLSPPTSFLKISAVSSFSHSLHTRHRGLWKVSSKDIKRMSHGKPEQSFFFFLLQGLTSYLRHHSTHTKNLNSQWNSLSLLKELIIWKFKAGEADLWLSMPCHGALTQTDLKEKALKKKSGPH